MIFNNIIKAFHHPILILIWFLRNPLMPDIFFIKAQYKYKTGKKLNLQNPVLFNEKIQWLKLYNRNPDYSKMIDKFEVRKYVSNTIGEEYLIPNYGVWDKFDDIPINLLPKQFILKSTHDSGGIIFCLEKQSFDIQKAKKFFEKRLARNWYRHSKEWAYKLIKPRILAEKLMVDEFGAELKDYKIFCFNGEPRIIQVDFDKLVERKRNFYSTQWELLPIAMKYPSAPEIIIKKPDTLSLMLELAKKLSFNIPHVRVDLYTIKDKVYFGELTFYNYAGYEAFEPPEWDRTFGDWLILPKI